MAKRTTHEQRVSKAARDVVDRRAGALQALADADEEAPKRLNAADARARVEELEDVVAQAWMALQSGSPIHRDRILVALGWLRPVIDERVARGAEPIAARVLQLATDRANAHTDEPLRRPSYEEMHTPHDF